MHAGRMAGLETDDLEMTNLLMWWTVRVYSSGSHIWMFFLWCRRAAEQGYRHIRNN